MIDGSSYHNRFWQGEKMLSKYCVSIVVCFFFSKQGNDNLDSNYILYKLLSHKYNWYRFVWRKHFNSILNNTQSPSNIMLYHHVLLYLNYFASQIVLLKSFLSWKYALVTFKSLFRDSSIMVLNNKRFIIFPCEVPFWSINSLKILASISFYRRMSNHLLIKDHLKKKKPK